MRCRRRSFPFRENYSLYLYRGLAREVIRIYKFERAKNLAILFADDLWKVIKEKFSEHLLVPVPPRRNKKRKEGWDQTEYLVDILKRRHGAKIAKILVRNDKQAQKELPYEERLSHLRDHMCMKRGREWGQIPLLIIDDIFTTGATVSECARLLREDGGASSVSVLSLAVVDGRGG